MHFPSSFSPWLLTCCLARNLCGRTDSVRHHKAEVQVHTLLVCFPWTLSMCCSAAHAAVCVWKSQCCCWSVNWALTVLLHLCNCNSCKWQMSLHRCEAWQSVYGAKYFLFGDRHYGSLSMQQTANTNFVGLLSCTHSSIQAGLTAAKPGQDPNCVKRWTQDTASKTMWQAAQSQAGLRS